MMIKSELIKRLVSENPQLHQSDVERIVKCVFDEIIETLSEGNRVELRGFGAFSVRNRAARISHNPSTGEKIHVEEKCAPAFKTGKLLHERLNKE